MKTLLHNFSGALRRFRLSTALNLIGMSVAFAVFLILMMQVTYEWGFDRFHKHADCLYRLEITNGEHGAQACLNRPLIEAFTASSPHIEKGAFLNGFVDKVNLVVEYNGERRPFLEILYPVSADYADVFEFTMIEGDRRALDIAGQVLIPQSMARKFFGTSSASGKEIIGTGWTATVGGVYRDFPANSIVRNAIYRKIPDSDGKGGWKQNNFECYIRLDHPSSIDGLVDNFKRNFRHEQWNWEENGIRLTALPDVYFETDCSFDTQKQKGSYTLIRLLSGIALLIVVIAAINFTNFSNAQVPMRVRSINTQKVLGGSVSLIRFSLVLEAVMLCLTAYLLALFYVYNLSLTSFADIVVGGLSLEGRLPLVLTAGMLSILIGVGASYWPARYITSFPPAVVLKGNFGLSRKGRLLRNSLVSLQFVVSFILIISALFVNLQNRQMLRMPLGFDKEQVVVVNNLTGRLCKQPDLIRQKLGGIPDIESLSLVSHLVGATDNYIRMGRSYKGEMIGYLMIHADPSILDVLGVRPTAGRNFQPEDELSEGVYIFNEMARKKYGLEPGDLLTLDMSYAWSEVHLREQIAGFMPDLKYNSFKSITEPFAFFTGKNQMVGSLSQLMIRTRAGADYTKLKTTLAASLCEIDPDYLPSLRLFDEMQDYLYEKELRAGRQITFFSLVTVLISLIGVFGVVMLESEYKRKEVGVRKVFGATVGELLCLFNKTYLQITFACFAVAAPVAYYAILQWQESFIYKVSLSWWMFLLAFVSVTAITLLTVSVQSWRVANANPVDSLKSE
ncbi:ABC transporter permease [uncultured Parabacteroides sp.]|uniref:ABC transporter permease n=1 Tax=uncultured Parabacteroides sp. TaxID=512312 RepID=UPI0026196729|nr:ABC transporter permease [uncultured Parabacteroides sp.]